MKTTLSAAVLSAILGTGGAHGLAAAQSSQSNAVSNARQAAQPGASAQTPASTANHASALYYFTLGHMQELQFEQEYEASGKIDLSSDAIDSYKKALALEPNSPAIMERLAEVEAESQRIRDAVEEAQDVLKLDPDNLAAHRLLARIYVRALGDMTDGDAQQADVVKAVTELQAILKLAPDDGESGLWLARLYRAQNKAKDAEKILRGILVKQPDNGDALEQLSQLLIDEGRSQEAVALLADAADQFSSPDIYDLLGDAYSQSKQYDKAESSYKKAVDMDPDDPGHRHGLADTLLAENKYSDALDQYKKLTQLEPGSWENYLRVSQLYRQLGQYNDSEASLMRAKQLHPGNLEILDNEAMLYDDQARYDDEVRVLNDAISGLKSSAVGTTPSPSALAILYKQLGDAYRHQKNYPGAIQAYADMGKLGDSAQKSAEILTIDTYVDSRDIDRAIDEAKKALAATPDDPSLTDSLAMLYGDKGDAATGTKILQGLLHGNDGDEQVYLDIAQVQEHGKKFADAEQSAEKAEQMAQQPDEKQTVWYMLGAIYEREKKYDQAAEEFQKVLDANPADDDFRADVLNYYGYMLADRGVRLDEATAMIQKAVAQKPSNGAYLDSLGWAYFKQGKYSEAVDDLRKAIALEGDDPTILSHLANAYMKLGQDQQAADTFEKSAAEWQKVLPADYEADKASEVDAQLKVVKKRLAQKSSSDSGKSQ
jgi:tetratricopeptide (TPR) repeat protein